MLDPLERHRGGAAVSPGPPSVTKKVLAQGLAKTAVTFHFDFVVTEIDRVRIAPYHFFSTHVLYRPHRFGLKSL